MRHKRIAFASALAAHMLATGAAAQSTPPAPQLDGREHATGVRIGSFLLRPSLTVSGEYQDNYLREETDPTASFIFRARPEAQIASDWNRHALRLEYGGEYGYFLEDNDDNYVDYFARGRLQLDVTRRLRANFDGGYAHRHESRGVDDVVDANGDIVTTEPVEFDEAEVGFSIDYKPNRLRLSPSARYLDLDYDDTPAATPDVANQDDRDRGEFRVGGEIGYEFRRGYEAFVGGEFVMVDYVEAVDDAGVNRDSEGYSARGGVNFEVTRLLSGSIGAGYFTRTFDDVGLEDVDGVGLDAAAIWSPSERTQVKIAGGRDVEETTISGVSGTTELFGRIEIDHAVRRNIVLSGFAAGAMEQFEGSERQDDNFSVGVGAEWLITRHFSAEATYAYETEQSSEDGAGYDLNSFFIGFSARY